MSANDVGEKLVALCKEGRGEDAVNELYADNVVSVEAMAPPTGGSAEANGIEAVRQKGDWWRENHEIHSESVEGPYPHGDRFAVQFKFDVTNKPSGRRMQMEEVALYTVENGKIVREEFFYTM